MSADRTDVFVVLGDEGLTVAERLLHGLAHIIREQSRHHQRIEELFMTIQEDVQALADRMSGATDRIERQLAEQTETVDLSPISSIADRLDSLAPADTPVDTVPEAPTNTTEVQPLYLVDGDANTDPSQWTPAAFVTVPEGRPLFTYTGDTAAPGSPATGDGVGGVWHVYVGDLAPTA